MPRTFEGPADNLLLSQSAKYSAVLVALFTILLMKEDFIQIKKRYLNLYSHLSSKKGDAIVMTW